MADKFFFKGRQAVRHNHALQGYQTKAYHRAGTKKYPLNLVVTSDARKQEVEAQAAEANLVVDVSIDITEGAVESIAELTLMLGQMGTVVLEKTPKPNEPCNCNSGKKYKKCCGSA